MKKNVLIIGAGGVGHVVAHKCAQHNRKLGAIHLDAERAKCQSRESRTPDYEKDYLGSQRGVAEKS